MPHSRSKKISPSAEKSAKRLVDVENFIYVASMYILVEI